MLKFVGKLEIRPTSMIDISDGLSLRNYINAITSELASNLIWGKFVDPTVTFGNCEEFKMDSTLELSGGED